MVCTDVGGSREIVIDGHLTYGAIAPPGNPRALAVAQLRVLGMLGGLEEMVSDPKAWTGVPKASHTPSLADYAGEGGAKRLTKRMHKALPARRQLGMLYVCLLLLVVQSSSLVVLRPQLGAVVCVSQLPVTRAARL